MPEIVEVEKLRRQLVPAWIGRTIAKFSAPEQSPNPTKYAQEVDWGLFSREVRRSRILGVDRTGKALWVQLEGTAWYLHLNSTGWLMPGNEEARRATAIDPIHENFLHSVHESTVRVRLYLDDGQLWDYHDSRTWGKWFLRPYAKMADDPYFQGYGPDWLKEPDRAVSALRATGVRRTVKTVLTDQKITAGLGNYLACEIAFRAGVHPHDKWQELTDERKRRVTTATLAMLDLSMRNPDHRHWKVFTKANQPCPVCRTSIEYAKDGAGPRGSYFCPHCQPKGAKCSSISDTTRPQTVVS